VARLQEAEAELYAIAIDTPDGNGQTLREAADDVDGIFSATSGTEELEGLYQSIADRLASRYRLTFDPNRDTGGSVVVSVNANDAVATARTRLVGTEVADTAGNADRPARVLNVPADAQLGIVPTPDPGLLGQQMMLPLGIGAVFLALLVVGFLVVNPAMDVRLDAAAGADRLAGVNERMSGIADRLIARRDSEGELDKALDAAGLNLRPGEFTLMALVGVMFMTMAGWLIGGFGLSALFAMIASVGTLFYLNRRAEKRRKQFADQLTDTLGILIGSLRAGRGLPQAIELVSAEAPSPTSDQFRRILFETQVGRDMTESMMSVSERMKSPDFEWVARAVQINRELGGDLTEVLGNVAETIRDRRRIDRMVQALSAEGRASGWVLLALPFLMFGFLWWRTPDNVDLLLGTSLGRTLLAAALAGMVVGYFWIRRLVNIEY
jgi:tight adherence protein B